MGVCISLRAMGRRLVEDQKLTKLQGKGFGVGVSMESQPGVGGRVNHKDAWTVLCSLNSLSLYYLSGTLQQVP